MIPKSVLDYYLECRKVECGANHNKNWSKSTKYTFCTSSRLYILRPPRSYQLEVQDQIKEKKFKCILQKRKAIPNCVLEYSLEYRKVKCEANRSKNWAKSTKYASCTSRQQYFLSLLRSYRLEVGDYRNSILGIFITSCTMKRALQWRYYS